MAPQAHLLLDTGPTHAELEDIRQAFHDVGMDADAQGHSYGGPPPTSAFLIVVNTPIVPFLDIFAGRGDNGGAVLRGLARRLLDLRADPRRWGRPHGLRLEDAHRDLQVVLGAELPDVAFDELLAVDLSRLDQASPPVAVEWQPVLRQWRARSLTAPVRITRRLPARTGSGSGQSPWRDLSEADIHALWRLVEEGAGSVIRWQRAGVILRWALGNSAPVIGRHIMLGGDDVRRILTNFARDGFASFEPGYAGIEPAEPAPGQRAEIMAIAEREPREFGLDLPVWNCAALAEFLVAEGVVDDIGPGWLRTLTALPWHG